MKKTLPVIGVVFILALGLFLWLQDRQSPFQEKENDAASAAGLKASTSLVVARGGKVNRIEEALSQNEFSFQNISGRDGPYWSGHTDEQIERAKKRELVFSRSRMPNEKGTRAMLKEALDSGIISQKEYYGELAHMLSDELDSPLDVIREIVSSSNPYGLEVMFMIMKDVPWYGNLTGKEREEVFSWLLKNKPAFTTDMSTISMSDVYRYENWLASSEKYYTQGNYVDYLDNFVLHKAEEPREFFALIYSGDYDRLVGAGKLKSVAYINKVVNDYTTSYPDNSVAKMILEKISSGSG